MRKKILLSIYIITMILFVGWLFCSNTIIADLSEKNTFSEIIWREDFFHDDVDFYLEGGEIQIENDLLESFGISGWAFVDTEDDNSDRYTSLILKNDEVCYEAVFSNYIKRTDARGYAKNGHLNNYMVGVANDFSTINIKDGAYDLYIFCRENEKNYGITDTGHSMKYLGVQIEKQGGSLKQRMWKAEEQLPTVKITEEQYTYGGIDLAWTDMMETDDGRLNIRGWVSVKELDCASQKVYIEFADEENIVAQYTTKKVLREDVANKYENEEYRQSGYKTSIPIENISDGQYTVKVLLENGGRVWSSRPYQFEKANDEIFYELQQSGKN